MKNVRFDSSKAAAFLPEQALTSMEAAVTASPERLCWRRPEQAMISLAGSICRSNYDKEEFARIQKAAEKIQKVRKVLLVIGSRFLPGSKSG